MHKHNTYITMRKKMWGGMTYILLCFIFPESEVERKYGSHEQGSLILHTSLRHVEKTGTHQLRWGKGENRNVYNNHSLTHGGGRYFSIIIIMVPIPYQLVNYRVRLEIWKKILVRVALRCSKYLH